MPADVLDKGQNAVLPPEALRLRIVVTWDNTEGDVDVDASALLLGAGARVRSDADFVFYNQPVSSDGGVQYLGTSSTGSGRQASLAVDLESVALDVTAIALTASVSGGSCGDLRRLQLLLLEPSGGLLASFAVAGADTETALLLGEIYRRGDGWKVRAVGQGWSSGLAGLAQDFGVTVEDEQVTAGDEQVTVAGEQEASSPDQLVDVLELRATTPTHRSPSSSTCPRRGSPAPSRLCRRVRAPRRRARVCVRASNRSGRWHRCSSSRPTSHGPRDRRPARRSGRRHRDLPGGPVPARGGRGDPGRGHPGRPGPAAVDGAPGDQDR